jgi:hypothetical protein
MAIIKLKKLGNFMWVTDLETNTVTRFPAKDTYYAFEDRDKTIVLTWDKNNSEVCHKYRVSDLLDPNGFSWGSFDLLDSFLSENLGFNQGVIPQTILVVDNYSALPNPTTVSEKFYWCELSQGTKYLPGTIGGTYYPSGMYYSNGVSWSFLDAPYQATQNEANIGINSNKFITPNTLFNSTQWNSKLNNPTGTTSQYIQGDGTLFDKFFKSIDSDIEVSTTSLTDVVVTGMTITPPAGTYKVDFNGEYEIIGGNIVELAQVDLSTLVLYLTNLTPTSTHPLTFGSGEIITPGIYSVNGAASVAGILTLNGGGDSNALFVFKIVGAFNTASFTSILLSNSANAANVFFISGGEVGIGANNNVNGNFIANSAAAALGANCVFNGRLLSTYGAIAFGAGQQSKPIVKSILELGILETFLCYTVSGTVQNTALAVITGDLGTNFGGVTIYPASVFNGIAYDDSQQYGNTSIFSLHNGTSQISNSERTKTFNVYTRDIILTGIAIVNGTETISVKWKTDIGRVILNNRIFTIEKL